MVHLVVMLQLLVQVDLQVGQVETGDIDQLLLLL